MAPDPPCTTLQWDRKPAPRNVVLVVSDTMRRDHMGIHGGRARTPAFDRFASEHLLFTQARTQSPWTKPAVATLFTGLHPSQHGVLSHPDPKFRSGQKGKQVLESDVLSGELSTLAEVLRESGYRTAAFVSNPWLQEKLGFAQGFDLYEDSFAGYDVPGEVVTAAALAWLAESAPASPWFLYVHTMDAHWPYPRLRREDVRERRDEIAADRRPMTAAARAALRASARYEDGSPVVGPEIPPSAALLELLYDRGVEHFDRALSQLLEGLEAHPGWQNTAVLVTSDHGEALFERGWFGHGRSLHEDETGVPLAARLPGVSSDGPILCPVGLVDVMATLSTYLGVEGPGRGTAGVSLLPPAEGADRRKPGYVVSEGVIGKPRNRAISNRHYKLIWEPDGRPEGGGPWALYALGDDPGERRNLLASEHRSARVERIFEILSVALREGVPVIDRPEPSQVPLDLETRDRLKALGYLD